MRGARSEHRRSNSVRALDAFRRMVMSNRCALRRVANYSVEAVERLADRGDAHGRPVVEVL